MSTQAQKSIEWKLKTSIASSESATRAIEAMEEACDEFLVSTEEELQALLGHLEAQLRKKLGPLAE